ncbi:hypothetical protein KGF54_004450 [Candida jiufengensis]|uniref:uncharacterized protein n=1 Tax=Candida jiufengensis TaxID=497108 RepID=UPI002224920A|nr:uncharacterized protein KGF54_004450 [Candida jiufengensis]KAI5951376.1 hypothetical protein KGF54_004450 [Candida jiufengensis]
MTEVSTLKNDIPNQENVDELFSKLSISEIQQIATKYKSIISHTKNELHDLVSDKYRDLIKIAEDISNVQQQTILIDGNLQELSYKPSTFVSPYNDNSQKFDTYIRSQNALKVQRDSRSIVVRNVMQNRLNKLNSKVNKNGASPLLHTSHFISFVQELYTINTVFQDILQKDKSLKSHINVIKNNLLEYFKFEISVYKITESILSSNDKFRMKQRLTRTDLILKSNDVRDADNDYEDEEGDDEVSDDEGENSKFDMINSSKSPSSDKNTSPLCNYLICYTILQNEVGNHDKVKQELIKLRINHITQLLSTLDPEDTTNYYVLLKYLENTCKYVEMYFEDEESSDYLRIISNINKPWSLTSLVGFGDWLDDTTVEFESRTNDKFTTENLQQQITTLISVTIFASFETVENTFSINNLFQIVGQYYSFFINLKKLNDNLELSGTSSHLIKLLSKSSFFNDYTIKLATFIKTFCQQHISKLNSEEGIIGALKNLISSTIPEKSRKFGFDSNFVNLMDYNVDEYIANVVNQTSLESKSIITQELYAWLEHFKKLKQLTDLQQQITLSIFSKDSEFTYLPRLFQTFNSDDVKWGEFTANTLKFNFETLHNKMDSLFKKELLDFCKSVEQLSQNLKDVDKLFFIVGLLTHLNTEFESNQKVDNNIVDKVNKLIKTIYKDIIQLLTAEDIDEPINLNVEEILKIKGTEIPTIPSLRLASTIYEIAQKILTHASTIEDQNINIFRNSNSLKLFVSEKNFWFKELANSYSKAIETKVEDFKNLSSVKKEINGGNEAKEIESTDKNEQEIKISKAQGLQIIANLIFILHFNHAPLEMKDVQDQITRISKIYGSTFDDNSLEVVFSGVSSFFKSRKNIYLPLSIV